MGTPAWDAWLASVWGPGYESDYPLDILGYASNVVIGTNPPYFVQDFLAVYPKFGGTAILSQGAVLVLNSQTVTVTSTGGMAVGNPVSDSISGLPDGTTITAILDSTHLTVSSTATASGSVTLTVWNAPTIPIFVLNMFIALASASLVQARWLEQWPFAMALFVAHYATLYALSDGTPNSTVGQVAAQGLSRGIQVSKAVGDVSVSYQPVEGIAEFAAFNLTSYGQLLATMAKAVGIGPMFLL